MSIAESMRKIGEGISGEGHYVYEKLRHGEELGVHADKVRSWAYGHPDENVRDHLVMAWALHSLRMKNMAAIRELMQQETECRRRVLIVCEDAWTQEAGLPAGMEPIILGCLEDEEIVIRWTAAHLLEELGEQGMDLSPYMPALAAHLSDHDRPGRAGTVSVFAARALYAATLLDVTREQAVKLLLEGEAAPDKTKSRVCVSAHVHHLADIRDLRAIDERIRAKPTHVRLGAAEGLRAAVYDIQCELDIAPIERNLQRAADGTLTARERMIRSAVTVEDYPFAPICERIGLLLQDRSREVRRTAAESLRHAQYHKRQDVVPALPMLIASLRDSDSSTLQAAASAVARCFDEMTPQMKAEALSSLEQLAEHSNRNVRHAAESALRFGRRHMEP